MFMLQHSGDDRYVDPVENAVGALAAGNDALLFVTNNNGAPDTVLDPNKLIDGVVDAVQNGSLQESDITKKAERMLVYRERAASFTR